MLHLIKPLYFCASLRKAKRKKLRKKKNIPEADSNKASLKQLFLKDVEVVTEGVLSKSCS